MEKYQNEIIQTLVDSYSDDKQLLADMLCYLYNSTDDLSLLGAILGVMNDLGRCSECGSELITYEFTDIHSELDNSDEEIYFAKLCSQCDRVEIEATHAKVKEM